MINIPSLYFICFSIIFLVIVIALFPVLLILIEKIRELVSSYVSRYDYMGDDVDVILPDYPYESYNQWEIESESHAEPRILPGYDVLPPPDDVESDLREMGWTKEGSYWYGWFTDMHGTRYSGRLTRSWRNNFSAEIKDTDLPDFVRFGKHGGCFLRPFKGWREIHFKKKQGHPKSLVAGVHQCINESYPAYSSVPAFYQRNREEIVW